jgi:hypothetical protein
LTGSGQIVGYASLPYCTHTSSLLLLLELFKITRLGLKIKKNKARLGYFLTLGGFRRGYDCDAPKKDSTAPKKCNYRTKFDQKIFLRSDAPKFFYFKKRN